MRMIERHVRVTPQRSGYGHCDCVGSSSERSDVLEVGADFLAHPVPRSLLAIHSWLNEEPRACDVRMSLALAVEDALPQVAISQVVVVDQRLRVRRVVGQAGNLIDLWPVGLTKIELELLSSLHSLLERIACRAELDEIVRRLVPARAEAMVLHPHLVVFD